MKRFRRPALNILRIGLISMAFLAGCAIDPEPAGEPPDSKRPRDWTSPYENSRSSILSGEKSLQPVDSRRDSTIPRTAERTSPVRTSPSRNPEKNPAPARSPAQEVDALIGALQDPRTAQAAFRRIWEVPKRLIPELILHVEDSERSRVDRIQVLILDKAFVGEGKLFLANNVHGLGKMEEIEKVGENDYRFVSKNYTKMSIGLTRSKKRRLVMDKFDGFPVGVVVRAGLINRFRSTRFPAFTDDDPRPGRLIRWWQAFYERAGDEVPEVGEIRSASSQTGFRMNR